MRADDAGGEGVLGAILLNPPLGPGAQTMRHLRALGNVVGCERILVANLFQVPTASSPDISSAGQDIDGWAAARPHIEDVLRQSTDVVLGWGLGGGITGRARTRFRAQCSWVMTLLEEPSTTRRVWRIGDQPRHPSRWHQYVSDKHGRATGENLEQRLSAVVEPVVSGGAEERPDRSEARTGRTAGGAAGRRPALNE